MRQWGAGRSRTTCGPIRSESTTSRRHCQSRPGRCCDPVPQALATDRSAACMPDRLGRGVSGSPSRCLSRLKRWPCRPTPPARHPTPASRSQPIVWPRRVRHRAGSLDQGISGGALFRCRSAPHWRPMARARRITAAGRCVVLPSAPAGRRHSSRPGRLDWTQSVPFPQFDGQIPGFQSPLYRLCLQLTGKPATVADDGGDDRLALPGAAFEAEAAIRERVVDRLPAIEVFRIVWRRRQRHCPG